MNRQLLACALICPLAFIPLVGCLDVPENPYGQSSVLRSEIYPTTTDAALSGGDGRAATAPAGNLLGVSGSFVIGQLPDKVDRKEAEEVSKHARENPASPADARQSATADLNKDGFVTLDEVVAMNDAGLDEQVIVKRLRITGQVFQITGMQEEYLINHGVNRTVVDRIRALNQPINKSS